jgi:hypothetical protein
VGCGENEVTMALECECKAQPMPPGEPLGEQPDMRTELLLVGYGI